LVGASGEDDPRPMQPGPGLDQPDPSHEHARPRIDRAKLSPD